MSSRNQVSKRCASCSEPLAPDATRCTCGAPTDNMGFAERAKYEVEKWRSYKALGT